MIFLQSTVPVTMVTLHLSGETYFETEWIKKGIYRIFYFHAALQDSSTTKVLKYLVKMNNDI